MYKIINIFTKKRPLFQIYLHTNYIIRKKYVINIAKMLSVKRLKSCFFFNFFLQILS